jgi:hypothetical protein
MCTVNIVNINKSTLKFRVGKGGPSCLNNMRHLVAVDRPPPARSGETQCCCCGWCRLAEGIARRESFADAVSPVPRKLLWWRQQLLLRGDGDKWAMVLRSASCVGALFSCERAYGTWAVGSAINSVCASAPSEPCMPLVGTARSERLREMRARDASRWEE